MKKGKTLCLVLSLLMLVSMFAVAGGQEEKKATGSQAQAVEEPKELRLVAQAWMLGKYKIEEAAAIFEKDHPGVKVSISKVDNADTTTNMLQWATGKTNSDIALGGSREQAVQYAAKGYIINFDEGFFDDKIKKEDFFPSFLELGNIEGTQYMIPITGEVMFIVVNKSLMKKAGLVDANGKVLVPKTWDELYEFAKKTTIVENGKTVQTGLCIDWGTNFMAYSYLACLQGMKGNFFEEDGKTIDFVSPEAKALMSIWAKLVKDGYTPTDTFADMDAGRTNFKAGKVAMHISAASRWVEAGDLLGAANVTVMPIPGTDKNGSLTYIHGAVIPKASPAQNLAKQFLKERLLDKDFHTYSVNKYGKMSPLNSHYTTAIADEWKMVIEATKKAATTPLYKDFARLDKGMQVELQKCITGRQTVDETSINLKKLIDSLDKTTGLK
ncbi:MAG TPA: extracellular solute-binding protein [Spirochaetia bacterium]|nr:extracellular solute-binding protein [Spirochaetia bacterium]